MDENEKNLKKFDFDRNLELNMTEFYKELNKAINTSNLQSIYGLSKIFTRYFFNKMDN